MKKFITRFLFTFIILITLYSIAFSQNAMVIDQFTDYTLAGWTSGGNISMKYSHKTDNAENGYGIVSFGDKITANGFVGILRKEQKIQFAQDNILSIMLEGVSNDVNATVSILFDLNNDGKYDENADARLDSKVLPLSYSGWKELHLNINDIEFSFVSKKNEDFSILEEEAIGFQITYQTGKDFKAVKIETGVALISERPNKEVKQETAGNENISGESYYNLKNYPNPFNPVTNISFTLKSSTNVKITVYDRLGREVAVLLDAPQSEGEHSITFDASTLPSGIYFYRVKTSEKTEVKKMVLAK